MQIYKLDVGSSSNLVVCFISKEFALNGVVPPSHPHSETLIVIIRVPKRKDEISIQIRHITHSCCSIILLPYLDHYFITVTFLITTTTQGTCCPEDALVIIQVLVFVCFFFYVVMVITT